MKAALILLGFFLCASVERIGFRKFRFVFRLGVFVVFILLALLCAGCDQSDYPKNKGDPEVEREYLFACLKNLPAYPGKDAARICESKAWLYAHEKANPPRRVVK